MVNKNHVEGAGGIKFTKPDSQVSAPWAGREEEEDFRQPLPPREGIPAEERVLRAGRIPLHPAAVRLPASIAGRIGFELTGYPGFVFSEQELNDLADLWCACGIEMNPVLQASIATTTMTAAKFIGYWSWVKMGKPPIPGAKEVGESTKEEEE